MTCGDRKPKQVRGCDITIDIGALIILNGVPLRVPVHCEKLLQGLQSVSMLQGASIVAKQPYGVYCSYKNEPPGTVLLLYLEAPK